MVLLRLYWVTAASGRALPASLPEPACHVRTERCVYVESRRPLTSEERGRLEWLLRQSAAGGVVPAETTHFQPPAGGHDFVFEIGPRLSHCTPFSTNAVGICHALGLADVTRLELARRYQLITDSPLDDATRRQMVAAAHDRMTECCYPEPLQSFGATVAPEPWGVVDVMTNGRAALQDVNSRLGLAFDDWDLEFYYQLFTEKLRRNPTTVECFDLAQSNSEHSRHWFFKGSLVVDGRTMEKSLLDMVIDTQSHSANNSVIKFSDNSSAIEGGRVVSLLPDVVDRATRLASHTLSRHVVFTAETHNFPTGVAPFSGATTGTGGRIRDVQAVGRGGHVVAGTAGYCVGQLLIPEYEQPWEDERLQYPAQFAAPRRVLLEASDGASDYGNKFGEPVVCGFTRSFGLQTPAGRREWVKPIMFSAGIGTMEADMTQKQPPEAGMLVVKLGGPVYRIGVGGGAASSVQVQGDNADELDFGAVQRGDAEMEQKLNRVIRACIEAGPHNPIASIHDQGAGGNGNVLKEIVEPAGAVIYTEEFQLGDSSISTLELWGAEYQESNAILCRPESRDLLVAICQREKCPVSFVGLVTGDGKVNLKEGPFGCCSSDGSSLNTLDTRDPVDLDLELVLGKMPQKVFHSESPVSIAAPLKLPDGLRLQDALSRVLRLPSVGSKRYLTNKVDRSVTGLVAQQQCVGPFHTPLADVAVIALSHYDKIGAATAIGEQPIKCLLDPAAGARLSVAEALTNLVFAPVTGLKDVKCSANWMWPAKLPGETAAIHSACSAMCDVMTQLGVAADGGKDSLSMAARVGGDTVKAPGSLVVSTYVVCPDVRRVVTPDLKSAPGRGRLLHVGLGGVGGRLGGSALAQCWAQLGDTVPDLDRPHVLAAAFEVTQQLIGHDTILSGHDVSDGGLIVCLLEMALAGGRGLDLAWCSDDVTDDALPLLLAEEPGWVLEVDSSDVDRVVQFYESSGATCRLLGSVPETRVITLRLNGQLLLETSLEHVTRSWEETSYRLELLQVEPACAAAEWREMGRRSGANYCAPPGLRPHVTRPLTCLSDGPKVAVIREEGTNGDREMAAALDMAGFQVWDVTMTDFLAGGVTLDQFRGVVFPGGFSYADVLGSAVGWAASVRFEPALRGQFDAFRRRTDTFSLGVCNGCQLMALLGWVGDVTDDLSAEPTVRLAENESGRFESRFSTVHVADSKSPLLARLRGARLGVWTAHGQGRFEFSGGRRQLALLRQSRLVALQYVDDDGDVTERYPHNPNGSPGGVAGICSPDGRHLAVMPHPERGIRPWQWAHVPRSWRLDDFSPWFAMFTGAYEWCASSC